METIKAVAGGALRERVARIENLDLEPIMVKLMDPEDGKGWSLDQCFTAEKWYKRFLILNLCYPEKSIIPNGQIDAFWHYHILDTMKYQEDCAYIFGYFLHHFPYLGLRGAEDAENLTHAFDETLQLFSVEFGESIEQLNSSFLLEATCHGNNCGNTNGRSAGPARCDGCHAVNAVKDFTRPTLASVLS
jgi:hypothetical protein